MSNINKIKNEKKTEIINPQTSNVSISELDNFINIFDDPLNKIFNNFLKFQESSESENKNKNSPLSLKKIFKEKEYNFEYEFYKNFDIYKTEGFYKEGKNTQNINDYIPCILLIKENYLYILKNNNSNIQVDTSINPEYSFLDKLESHNIVKKEEIKYIKGNYELSKPLLCLNFNLLTCELIINKKRYDEFTILILGITKQYSFIIKDQKIKNNFCYILGTFITNSDGYVYNQLNLIFSHPKSFNKNTYITPDYFEYIAKTGDLILFKTNHILTKDL